MTKIPNLIPEEDIIKMALKNSRSIQILLEKTERDKIDKYCKDKMISRSLLGRKLFLELLEREGLIKKKGK